MPTPDEHPHGIAFDGSGEAVYVTWEGTIDRPGGVAAYDRAGNPLWDTAVGIFTLGVAWAPPRS